MPCQLFSYRDCRDQYEKTILRKGWRPPLGDGWPGVSPAQELDAASAPATVPTDPARNFRREGLVEFGVDLRRMQSSSVRFPVSNRKGE
jgi:hypothetical protein